MKNFLYIIIFLVVSFLLNILIYYVSPDYRWFLKEIKGVENIEQIEENKEEEDWIIEDRFNINNDYTVKIGNVGLRESESVESSIESIVIEKQNEELEKNLEEKIQEEFMEEIEEEDMESVKVEYVSAYSELKITKIEEEFLNKFTGYKLKELELHPRLFDLTSEYPDNYFEYYSEYLTLYFFGNKPYNEIRDVFEVLTYELPFTLNEVNNFWEKSFYINLDENFEDWVVRLVLLYKNRTFWLKLKKEVYDHVKGKIDGLK